MTMIVEQRTYALLPPKMRAWLECYETYGLPIQNRHLGGLVGFFVSEIGQLNHVVHLWKYESLADREQRRGAMVKDPAWPDFLKRAGEINAILSQESKILVPTSFSPLK
jgi:hypothetical protein